MSIKRAGRGLSRVNVLLVQQWRCHDFEPGGARRVCSRARVEIIKIFYIKIVNCESVER